MRFRLTSWRPAHLVAASCAYWVGLALWTIGPRLMAAWHLAQSETNWKVAASVRSQVRFTMIRDGTTVWMDEMSLLQIALWIAVPPLILWMLWLRAQTRPPTGAKAEVGAGMPESVHPSPSAKTPEDRSVQVHPHP